MISKLIAIGRLSRAGVLHHLFGIGGQVAAAAPQVLVTMILSHTVGLATAGQFVIAAGAAAIVFTFALLGLKYYVSIDGLREFDARDYVLTRLSAIAIAALVLLVLSVAIKVPIELVLLVALLRAADGAAELALGLDLLRRPSEVAMQRYALLSSGKLVIVLLSFAPMLVFVVDPVRLLVAGAALAALVCWLWLLGVSWEPRLVAAVRGQVSQSLRLARRALWFTVAACVCAAAMSMPRLLMPRFYDGDVLGVVGVSLAFGTAFSMAFASSWLRWFPRLSRTPESERRFFGFVLESSAMGLFFLLLTVTVAPWIVSILFGFDASIYADLCEQVLLAWVAAAFAINMANVFKLTRAVWLESLAHVVSIVAGFGFVVVLPAWGVPGYLLAAAIVMLAVVVGGMAWVRRDTRDADRAADEDRRAVFLRLATRPVPRIVRMMRVARDAGFDPIFVGAFREAGVPAKDVWDGFPLRRVGRPFPLLNGKNPWLYVRSVVSCNFGFWVVLRAERPSVIHASDFETMPASFLYRLSHRCRLVYNIHDNLALRYDLPAAVNLVLNAIEGAAVLLADQALVPEPHRRDLLPRWCRNRVSVIRNLPPDTGPTPPLPFENGKIRIFYGGWLDWQRGLGALLLLAREPDIELRVAGEGAPEIVAALKANPAVTYLGFLSSQGVLEETKRCHFVPVLYDPSRAINRFSASNKLAEALSIGRPIIVNDELEIANALIGARCAIDVRYAEADRVAPRLRALANDPTKYADACVDARRAYEARYDWEKAKADSLHVLTGESVSVAGHGRIDQIRTRPV